ncbi:MAG: rhomboid family intramembrane serine protease [Chloroflexi bacterium]|jgi:rhomboid protease GluP|nr:rhomboid family intramembrane serine protease [Chloroflexota bacterium]
MIHETPPSGEEQQRQVVRVQMPDRKPVVTIILVAITVGVFILQHLLLMATGIDFIGLFGKKVNEAIMQGQVWRLLTPALLHGGILHLVMNMYALFIIGSRLERFYGPKRFLLLYVLSAFAGNVFSFVFTPAPSLGASTAIFGIFAAEGILIYQNRRLFGQMRTRQAITNLALILTMNLAFGFIASVMIDNMGHIGGLLGGIFFAWKAGPILKLVGAPPYFSVADSRERKDVLAASLVVFIGFIIIALIPFLKT